MNHHLVRSRPESRVTRRDISEEEESSGVDILLNPERDGVGVLLRLGREGTTRDGVGCDVAWLEDAGGVVEVGWETALDRDKEVGVVGGEDHLGRAAADGSGWDSATTQPRTGGLTHEVEWSG